MKNNIQVLKEKLIEFGEDSPQQWGKSLLIVELADEIVCGGDNNYE